MKKMRFHQINQIILLPFQHPVLLLISLTFSVILYAVTMQASVYDIQNPKWIATMAVLILVSPLFHGVFILLAHGYQTGKKESVGQALSQTLTFYPRLVAGEILVNLIVVAGLFFFLLPGIYAGLRLLFYKQAILIDRVSGSVSLQASSRRTPGWRIPLSLVVLLAPFYGLVILIGYAVLMFPLGAFGDALALISSAFSFAWVNTLLTVLYQGLAAAPVK